MSSLWDIEKIKEGFEKFQIQHGRLPTSPEIDQLEYLPSSRQIQRKFGGLEKLRNLLGYKDTHFGKGKFRGQIANRSNIRGRDTELVLEKILRDKFGEVFVHTEKIFDDSKNRVDFYIYSPDGNFGIDIFYTETMRDLQKNINIKIDKYKNFKESLYFVVGNNNFTQETIDLYNKNKSKKIPPNIGIINLETLLYFIKDKKIYSQPTI